MSRPGRRARATAWWVIDCYSRGRIIARLLAVINLYVGVSIDRWPLRGPRRRCRGGAIDRWPLRGRVTVGF